MLGRWLLPSSITVLVPAFSITMLLPVAAWRHCCHSGWRCILCSGRSHRTSAPLWGATMVTLCTTKRVLLGSPWSRRHSISDYNIWQKYSWMYGALWTYLEGSIFAIVFVRITTCNILKVHTGHTNTFPLNISLGQGRHPSMSSQRAPGMGGILVFGAQPTLHFIDQLQNWQAPERRHAR